MIKIFLVEDEIIVRNGIKDSIDWESEGFEFAGEASDGELALPLIKKIKPDILITDIKMPFMNGIELGEAVHKVLPDIKIIFLSGYGEFEYAQKAIRIGIEEYLLKPISSVKLLEAIKKVAAKIEQKRQEEELKKQYLEEMSENTERKKEEFFTKLIEKEVSVSEILEEGEILGIDLSAESYCIMLFKIRTRNNEFGYSQNIVTMTEMIDQFVNQEAGIYAYHRGIEGFVFLFLDSNEENMNLHIRRFTEKMISLIQLDSELEYFGGIGSCVERLRELKKSYFEANKAFSVRFMRDWSTILTILDLKGEEGSIAESEKQIENLESMDSKREMIEKFLKVGIEEEVEDFVDGYLDNINRNNMESIVFRQYIIMDFYICVLTFEEKLGLEEKVVKQKNNINQIINSIKTAEQTRDYMNNLLYHIIRQRDQKAGKKYSDIMNKATEYIYLHYMEDEISLNAVACEVNISPSYFSSIFAKEEGKTFTEYLTNIRMDKAKELLICSSMKTSEVGFEVGYKDPHYFSYIFKKTQLCSPKEYRSRRE